MHTFTALRLPPDNMLFPGRLEIDASNVTYYKGAIVGYKSTDVARSSIASVSINNKILFADVIIETKGGKRIAATGFRSSDARTIAGLLSHKTSVNKYSRSIELISRNYYSDYEAKTFLPLADLQYKITKALINTDLLNAAVFWITNIARKKYNLKQFQFHDKLRQTATLHSEQMKRHNFFDHINAFDARYKTLTDRIDSVKDNNFQGFMSWGENIADYPIIKADEKYRVENRNGVKRLFSASGKEIFPYTYYEYAKSVVEGLMNSPGHRENILNPDYEYLGCGCASYENQDLLYFKLTQNFGGRLDTFLKRNTM